MSEPASNVKPLLPINTGAPLDFLHFIGTPPRHFRAGDLDIIGNFSGEKLKRLAAANRAGSEVKVRVRTKLVVQTDGTRSLDGCKAIAQEINLKPSRIYESGPKEYDVIFDVDPAAIADDDAYVDLRQKLAKAFAGAREISEWVRLPGFWNLSNRDNPFKSTLVYSDPTAPAYTAEQLTAALADGDDIDDNTADKPSVNLPLCALDEIDETADPKNANVLCQRWVWIVAMERFIRRLDPTVQWKASQMDSRYNFLAPKANSLSKALFRRQTILRRFDRPVFEPGNPETRGECYNLWRPSGIIPAQDDTTLWNAHIEWLIPDAEDRAKLLDWLAWVIQNPTQAPGYALLLVGAIFGTGKSFIARVMEQIIGTVNTQRPKNSSIRGDFNPWAALCRLAIIEELNQIGRTEVAHELRDMITEPTIEVNPKNINPYKIANYIALMAISNEPDALPIQPGDRRWLVIDSPVTEEQKNDAIARGHFRDIMPIVDPRKLNVRALGAIAWELQHRKTPGVINFTPGNAPITEAKRTMISLSMTPLDKWLTENAENDPLNRTLVNIRTDILERVPADIVKVSRNLENSIQKWIKAKKYAVALGNHRVNGQVVKVWGMNDLGREVKARIAQGAKLLDALGTLDVGAMVEGERKAAGRKAEATAKEDFVE